MPSIGGVTLVFVWFATWGTWNLFQTEDDHCSFADRFFNAQAAAIKEGRLDVPPETIEFEAFVVGEKHYGYFGIVTALMRVPLNVAFPHAYLRWNRLIATAACVVNLIGAYLMLLVVRQLFLFNTEPRALEKWLYSLFIWTAGLGSANIYLGSRTFMYHEPIIWGAAFALLFYVSFLRYLIRPRFVTLLLASIFSVLAFHTRAPQGAGTVFCLGLFAVFTCLVPSRGSIFDLFGLPKVARPYAHAGLAVMAILVSVGTYSLLNYAKFESWSGMPLHLYKRYPLFKEMETYRRIEGKAFHLSNARMMAYDYFHPAKIRFAAQFPGAYLVEAVDAEEARFKEAKLDFASEFSSFPASQTALVFLSAFGIYAAIFVSSSSNRTKLRLPLLSAAVAGSLILFFINIAQRYLHDFYPFWVIAAAAGLHQVFTIRIPAIRWIVWLILVPLALYSAYVNTAFALVHQREVSHAYGNPWFEEKSNEFKQWRETIDSWVAEWRR